MARGAKVDDSGLNQRSGGDLWVITDECFHTLAARKTYYEELRAWYWHGADDISGDAEINRIYGEINNILSLTYSPEQIILEGLPEGNYDPIELPILRKLTKTVRDNFFYRRIDVKSTAIVLNALIDGTSFIKPVWTGGVDWKETPADHIGVMFEALPIDSEYQVFATETEITEAQLKTWWPHIFAKVGKQMSAVEDGNQGQLEVILGGQGSTTGTIEVSRHIAYKPRSSGNTYRCRQLWTFEHQHNQWRRATIVEQVKVNDVLIGRSRHPYIQICPNPVSNWIWGHSAVRMLMKVQDKRNKILDQIDDASARLLDPPLLGIGYNIGSESLNGANAALKEPGGSFIFNGGPNSKIEPWVPKLEIGAAYEQLNWREQQTKFITGVNEIMQGQSQKNVRSSGYANMLAQFASTELKRVAHTIEAQFEDAHTYTGQLFQENDSTQYKDEQTGRTFYLGQFPFDYRIEIYGHTGSPIATENNINLSMQLHDKKLMPADILIDILPIPFKEQLKDYAKKMEQAAMAMAAQKAAQGEAPEAAAHKGKHPIKGGSKNPMENK